MTIRYIELLDVDLPIKKWEDHELEAAVREWWKKVNSTPWNPIIAAANFRLRLPAVRETPEHIIRYPRAMADDVKLLRAIAERRHSESDFSERVIRKIVDTRRFEPETLMQLSVEVPDEVTAEFEVLRKALGIAATVELHHVGVCDLELPRPAGATITFSTMKGEYADEDGNAVAYQQWIFDVYEPARLRLSIEMHGDECTRHVIHPAGVNVAPLLDALKERGLAVLSEEAKL
ncbi:MAG: hypothetical protein QM817_08685 [Archangium sp.]